MLLRRPLQTLPIHLLRRHLSAAAAEAIATSADHHAAADPLSPPYRYLPGHPRPDAKHDEERKAGRVPAIVFEQENGQEGGNKRLVSSKQIRKLVDHLGRSFFLSRLFRLQVWSEHAGQGELVESVRVLPRKVHLHAGTDEPLNITFMRAPSSALLKIDVPLMFIGEDASPGLKKGAYFNTIKRTVKYLCPADIVPPYIEVDLSELDVGQKLLMRDLKVHPALKLLQSPDQPICSIIGSRAPEQKKGK
ncbi:LOW QUALITY PROTEIN: hypothetical protein U9M48_018577 [Paspalum notatum var. saurae]|uniref:Ribosomal protein L25 beta domain-containing protein n=1 Tax=Paspalum notatum var. saurae TaxID=547442 RepID=A0AAQ3T9P4_PASNO